MSDRDDKKRNENDLAEIRSLIGDTDTGGFSLEDILAEYGSGKVPGRPQVEKSIRSQTRKGRSEKPAFFIAGRFFAEIPVICAGTGFTALFPSCLPAVHAFPAFQPMIPPRRNMGIYIEMRITATRRPTRRIRAGSSSAPMRLIRNSSSSVSTSP